MECKASFNNRVGSNAVVTRSDTRRNILGRLSFAIKLLFNTYSINRRAEQGWLWIPSTWKWDGNDQLPCVDKLKLPGRTEDGLENEIKIVKAINKDINMNFGLEKRAKIFFKGR